MVKEADRLSFIKVNSEFESLLLEAKLIRAYQPKYNSVSKDDKHPLYITITKDEFPRIVTTRRQGTFGPFPSSQNVKQVLKMLRRIFPYSDHKVGKRACLYSQINLCSPCPSVIKTKEEKKKYLSNIRNIKSILKGNIAKVKNDLEKGMKSLANEEKFEEAALLRQRINQLEYITQPRIPSDSYLSNPNLVEDVKKEEINSLKKILNLRSLNRIECYDVSHLSGAYATASMVVFADGEADKSQYRHFRIRQEKTQSDYDSIREVAKRRLKQNWPRPNLIIVDGGVGQVKAFESEVPVVGIAKNPDRLIVGARKIKLEGSVLNLIGRIRDEAHRFARRYHYRLISINLSNENR